MTNTKNAESCVHCARTIEGGGHEQTTPFPHECVTAWGALLAGVSPENFLLSACAAHGTKETTWEGGGHYVELVREFDRAGDPAWRCCDHMVIDPWGAFDH